MIGGLLVLIGTAITIGVGFAPFKWFLREGRYSKVDKCQMVGVTICFIGLVTAVYNALRIS